MAWEARWYRSEAITGLRFSGEGGKERKQASQASRRTTHPGGWSLPSRPFKSPQSAASESPSRRTFCL